MSDMIEQVAKAMWDVRRAHAMNEAGIELEFWGDGTIPKANGIMDEARAAIEAMREPTDEMVAAGERLEPDYQYFMPDYWRAMIEVALSPSQT